MYKTFLGIYPYRANWIAVSTYRLKAGNAIILSVSDETAPSFGIVKQILCDSQIILLCINQCSNIAYQSHLRAWEVKQSPEASVVKFDSQITQQILQPIPANFNTYYISLKYALLLSNFVAVILTFMFIHFRIELI